MRTIVAVICLAATPAAAFSDGPFETKADCLAELSTAIDNHDRLEYRAERAAMIEGLPEGTEAQHAALVQSLQASADAYGEAVSSLLAICAAYPAD